MVKIYFQPFEKAYKTTILRDKNETKKESVTYCTVYSKSTKGGGDMGGSVIFVIALFFIIIFYNNFLFKQIFLRHFFIMDFFYM